MIAVDTNILIYAHRRDSPFFERAASRIRELAEDTAAWAIPWPCLHEFLAVSTHPRIYKPPSSIQEAIGQIERWRQSPTLVMLAETEGHWRSLRDAVTAGQVIGRRMHDARIAAICDEHGVRELWTADRDFSRFPRLRAVNPLMR